MAKETTISPGETSPSAPQLQAKLAQTAAFSRCHCEDCEAAVSPLAYLADLMEYVVKHVKNDGADITLKFLKETFYQPLGDLPAACEEMDKKVRQVRLCIEVLRRYLYAKNLPIGANKKAALASEQKHYVLEAYQTLLTKLGTSFEDVRLVQTGTAEERKALADRLGIHLGNSNYDHLATLLLDPHTMTEAHLEQRFGLVDARPATRDPLSEGAKRGDGNHQIRRWNFTDVEWGRNTGFEGPMYGKLTKSANKYQVDLYRDSQHTQLVATGAITSTTGVVKLTEKNGSGLSGELHLKYSTNDGDIRFDVVPYFLAWRLQQLREFWKAQDWPEDPFTEGETFAGLSQLPQGVQLPASLLYDKARKGLLLVGMMTGVQRKQLLDASADADFQLAIKTLFAQSQRLPIIDPDVIGPDDFRNPVRKETPNLPDQPFDVWLDRRASVDALIVQVKNVRGSQGFDVAIQQTLEKQTPGLKVADVEALASQLKTGEEAETAKLEIQALGFSVESFMRLLTIREKHLLAESHPKYEAVKEEEWRECDSILAQAEKFTLYPDWIEEEKAFSDLLSPTNFWIAQRSPKEGDWPPLHLIQKPLVDPELVKPEELPVEHSGKNGVRLPAH